jgi:ATP-dependent Clp protease ATP-binding subunit ClpB
MKDLKAYFRPEFLNRLDDIVIFEQLNIEAIKNIVSIMFDNIKKKVSEREITIELSNSAIEYIASAGFDPVYGARPLKRALYDIVEDKLAELILEDNVKAGDTVSFDVKDEEMVVTVS